MTIYVLLVLLLSTSIDKGVGILNYKAVFAEEKECIRSGADIRGMKSLKRFYKVDITCEKLEIIGASND